jgi:cytochrome c oxidase cbb3-type subunit I/II
MEMQQFYYDNKIVKKFIYATIVFGVGMLVDLFLLYVSFQIPMEFRG